MKKFILLIFAIFTFSSFLLPQKLEKLTFIPHWLPQSQFAGYYYAYEKGIYKKYGIDITILIGGPQNSAGHVLEKNKVDVASMWLSNAIDLRSKGIKIVNIGQLINKSSLMLVAKRKSGILKPSDMNNKKVGIWGGDFSIQPLEFFKKYNLNVKIIQQGSSINLFLMDGVDISSAMIYNEYHTMLNSGLDSTELVTFKFSDFGINFPEDGLYCTEETYNQKFDLLNRFIKATLEGWRLAVENSEETIRIVRSYMLKAHQPVNLSHQRWMLKKMDEFLFPDKNYSGFGELKESDFNYVVNSLKSKGILKNIPKYSELYKPILKGIVR